MAAKNRRRNSRAAPEAGPFRARFSELAADFGRRGIPTASPTFCDHPAFLAAEEHDPRYLNHFGAFVGKRAYDDAYLARAETIITEISQLLHKELLTNGRLGACVDMSGILVRALQHEGVWGCAIKGSLTIRYPSETKLSERYFWSVDHGEFVAGHAWVFAPPFTVVDATVHQQPYKVSVALPIRVRPARSAAESRKTAPDLGQAS